MPRRNLKMEELQARVDELEAEREVMLKMLSDLIRPTVFGSISVVTSNVSMFAGTLYAKDEARIRDWLKIAHGHVKTFNEMMAR